MCRAKDAKPAKRTLPGWTAWLRWESKKEKKLGWLFVLPSHPRFLSSLFVTIKISRLIEDCFARSASFARSFSAHFHRRLSDPR